MSDETGGDTASHAGNASAEWVYERGATPRLGKLVAAAKGFKVEFDDGTVVERRDFPRSWSRVASDSFYFRSIREPDRLRADMESDPMGVMVLALEALSPLPAEKARLKEIVTSAGLIDADAFDQQWKKVQTQLRKHPHVVAKGKPLTYKYTAEAQAPTETTEDLLRELGSKATAESRKAVIAELLGQRQLSVLETAWRDVATGGAPASWASLVGVPANQDVATALRGHAVQAATAGDLDATRFIVEQVTNPKMKAVAHEYARTLTALPRPSVDSAFAWLVDQWGRDIAQPDSDDRASQRLLTRLSHFRDVPIAASGPMMASAFIRLLSTVSDDRSSDGKRIVGLVAQLLSRLQRPTIEEGAVEATRGLDGKRVAMGVRSLRLSRGSVREAALRGAARASNPDQLMEPRIWNGATEAEIVRLLDDETLASVLANAPLRDQITIPAVARYVDSATLPILLSLIASREPLRSCLPRATLLERAAALARADDDVQAALDELAGAPWAQRLETSDAEQQRLQAELDAANGKVDAVEHERDTFRSRLGEVQSEAEAVRRTSGAQARFDALRGLAEIVIDISVWSTHPDRLKPDGVLDQAIQRAKAHGLELVGEPGAESDFDASLHRLLAGDHAERVTVVEPGVVLREAGAVRTLIHAKVQPIAR